MTQNRRYPDSHWPDDGVESVGQIPSWGHDLARMMGAQLLVTVVSVIFLWAAGAGLFEATRDIALEDFAVVPAILAAVYGLVQPALMYKKGRPDSGFRRSGLLSLVLLSTAAGALMLINSSAVWPWLTPLDSGNAHVADMVGRHPAGFLHTGSLFLTTALIALPCFFVIRVFPFPSARAWLALAGWIVGGISYTSAALVIGLRPVSLGGTLFLVLGILLSAGFCIIVIPVAQRHRARDT